jgi:(S)-2-hydroxyglutarate dehydrogenase
MQYDIIIVGGGIVGLATAYSIKSQNPSLKLAVLEKESEVASHQTGNNSGVIHSGLYYKPGSLKAVNCINGYKMLLDFCDKEGIPYELCGKIVVAAQEEELPRMENLYQRGLQNGLTDIKKINAQQLRDYEPHAAGIAGIWVPYTGIIDYKDVCNKYVDIITNRFGGEVILNQEVKDINIDNNACEVITKDKTYKTRLVINTAGLYSDKMALLTRKIDVRIIPFRGEYYEVKKEKHHLVKNLIYPVPRSGIPFPWRAFYP